MQNILFVCTGNSCRSVMAEGLFKKIAGGRAGEFAVGSAGVAAVDGFPPTDETVRAMKEEGVDVSGHRTRRLTPERIKAADRILVMEKMHKDWILRIAPDSEKKVFLLTEFSSEGKEGIPDPIRMSDYFYKNTLATIRDCVTNLVKKI
ncbi:MAG: low molecular weight protein arginine phosphatase [Candidatus Omnitrophica bacterium]|nr:low molecular weight protein arginine phosphatase [Candidatus Omnitrophota bacterium]